MTRVIPIIALFALAACQNEAEAPIENDAAENTVEEAAPVAETSLVGDYQVTGLNGGALNQVFEMDANVTDERLQIRSECVRMDFTYTLAGNAVDFEPAGQPGCARVKTANEEGVHKALSDANIALFQDDGSVMLSGPGGTLTMAQAGE